jgi:hypothetical protein
MHWYEFLHSTTIALEYALVVTLSILIITVYEEILKGYFLTITWLLHNTFYFLDSHPLCTRSKLGIPAVTCYIAYEIFLFFWLRGIRPSTLFLNSSMS